MPVGLHSHLLKRRRLARALADLLHPVLTRFVASMRLQTCCGSYTVETDGSTLCLALAALACHLQPEHFLLVARRVQQPPKVHGRILAEPHTRQVE